MCCFSRHVEVVEDTNIFARSDNGRQFLVYSMSYAAASDLAMVLPLPVPPGAKEDAVQFINLQHYPTFFDDMRSGFPRPILRSRRETTVPAAKLRVQDVGDFEASFVPGIADFDRLDERFRIRGDVWQQMPGYAQFGFAVFKLKASVSRWIPRGLRKWFGGNDSSVRRVHPMAFSFPRRNPDLLYFPTVHIHDQEVHSQATFDHELYCQAEELTYEYLRDWEKSPGTASAFMNISGCERIVDPDQCCWRLRLKGELENKDTLIGEGGAVPELAAV